MITFITYFIYRVVVLIIILGLTASCTPVIRQAVLPKSSNEIQIVQEGSFYLTPEEEKFIVEEAKHLGIEVPDRKEIRKFLKHYLSNKRHLGEVFQRANLYLPIIKPILREYGLPEELAYLPVIESGFNPFARSPSGAVGLWQFMIFTARKYGLRIDRFVDERRDVIKSTHAAAKYLKDLYEEFGNWELALAAYNCGEGCVRRKTGGRDFWVTKKNLPSETRKYVPAFFAILLIARDMDKYGVKLPEKFEREISNKRVNEMITVDEIVSEFGISESVFRDMNPHIKGDFIPPGTLVYLPMED